MDTKPEIINKDDFARKCYGVYKLKWLADHGISLEDVLSSIETFIQERELNELPESEFHDYIRYRAPKITDPASVWESLNIYGENGKYLQSFGDKGFYKSFNMFLSTEFNDKRNMKALLGEDSEMFKTWTEFMKPGDDADEPPTNVVYCERDCVNQENGYCRDCGVAIDNDGYCTGYQQN